MHCFDREAALSRAAVTAAGPPLKTPVYGQQVAPSANVTGANERIAIGGIGLGPCHGLVTLALLGSWAKRENIAVSGACDLYRHRALQAGKYCGLKEAELYEDYPKLLERKDIDAVMVAPHDPWHARICIDALEAGKHVYCEKPLTRYLDEAFRVYETVKRTRKVFQIGAPSCSSPVWRQCAELIQADRIGTLVSAQAAYCRNNSLGEWNFTIDPQATAQTIDWERWLGPVKLRVPFSPEHFHRWRKYYQYSAGPLADLAPHRLHSLLLATGKPEFPTRVCSIGSGKVGVDGNRGEPERDVPEHARLLAEFPGGFVLKMVCSSVNAKNPGLEIYGTKGSLEIKPGGGGLVLSPEKEVDSLAQPEAYDALHPDDLQAHFRNWFDCIRSNRQPNGNIELAVRVQTVLSLAEMSDRLKIACSFDERTRKITDGTGREVPPITYGTLPAS
jgi:predicted dehydrogenase